MFKSGLFTLNGYGGFNNAIIKTAARVMAVNAFCIYFSCKFAPCSIDTNIVKYLNEY